MLLEPEEQWRRLPVDRFFSDWPGWLKTPLASLWPEERRITKQEILAELQSKTPPQIIAVRLPSTQHAAAERPSRIAKKVT